ncbi:TM2 domain-containing protein [Salinicola aestuarinus]|uniref:TM2 domain-containing protein n=1 Tax=Salinicola aestuarinus TaxID=1949082 RepID=UPI000DA220D5|nr:TM2 domain-containing protein [Salinicola aestuarinus]
MENSDIQGPQKNRILALILSMGFGFLGLDRFYLGKWKSALFKVITIGGLGLWWFIDATILLVDAFLYSLGKQKGMMKDSQGRELKYGLSLYRLHNGSFEQDWFK